MREFDIGTVVIITGHNNRTNPEYDKIIGKKGIIKLFVNKNRIGLKVEGINNPISSFGYFYVPQNYIVIQNNEGEDNMSKINKYKGTYKIATIVFLDNNNGRVYNYRLYNDGVEYKEEDIVVVMSAHHGMGIARIKNIYEPDAHEVNGILDDNNSDREIICRIDMTKYIERKQKAEKISNLKGQMDKKVKELQGVALYELMAQNCPELQEMLNEYKRLITN